jgi:tetratricopeptide (TPR) repeat protein
MRFAISLSALAFSLAAPTTAPVEPAPRSIERAGARATSAQDSSYSFIVTRAERANAARRWSEAAELWRLALSANEPVPEHWWALGQALFNGGRHRESIAAFERAMQLGADCPATGAWNVARAYAHTDNRKQALRWLARAIELGFDSRRVIREEPLFERYHADPRFAELSDSTGGSRRPHMRAARYRLTASLPLNR